MHTPVVSTAFVLSRHARPDHQPSPQILICEKTSHHHVLAHWDFSHRKFRLLSSRKAICSSRTTQPTVHAGCFSVSMIHQTLTWTTEFWMWAQMLMHAISHWCVGTCVIEYALKVDFGRKILCCTRESNLPQWCAGPMFHQLSHIPASLRPHCFLPSSFPACSWNCIPASVILAFEAKMAWW